MQEKPTVREPPLARRLVLKSLHVLVTTEHLTNPDFEQEIFRLLGISLGTKVLYELAETRCIEFIKGLIESLNAARILDDTLIAL